MVILDTQLLVASKWANVKRLCRWAKIPMPRLKPNETLNQYYSRQIFAVHEGLKRHCSQQEAPDGRSPAARTRDS